jgi:perosamine synthetase
LSFNGNKIVTTGGGGAILTNNDELASQARHLSTQAKLPHPWAFHHDQIGYNYRMPNLNAALGCAQLEQLPRYIQLKRVLAQCYKEAFKEFDGVKIFQEPDYATSNYWLNVMLLNEKNAPTRDLLLDLTHKQNIMTRPAWTPMHKLPMYNDCPRMDLSVAEDLAARIVNLPSSAYLALDL